MTDERLELTRELLNTAGCPDEAIEDLANRGSLGTDPAANLGSLGATGSSIPIADLGDNWCFTLALCAAGTAGDLVA